MDSMIKHVFVYGTLKRGKGNNFKMRDKTEFVSEAHVPGKLYDCGLPCYVMDDEGTVHGEVFLIKDGSVIDELDWFEGYNSKHPDASLYIRAAVKASLPDGSTVDAWVYEYNDQPSEKVRLQLGVW